MSPNPSIQRADATVRKALNLTSPLVIGNPKFDSDQIVQAAGDPEWFNRLSGREQSRFCTLKPSVGAQIWANAKRRAGQAFHVLTLGLLDRVCFEIPDSYRGRVSLKRQLDYLRSTGKFVPQL